MKKRRTSSMDAGMIFSPLLLFLFFVVAFSSLFYVLYDDSSSFERERAQRDLRILSSALQTTLLADEEFFLANIPRAAGGVSAQRECQQYIATHPEIASAGLKGMAFFNGIPSPTHRPTFYCGNQLRPIPRCIAQMVQQRSPIQNRFN